MFKTIYTALYTQVRTRGRCDKLLMARLHFKTHKIYNSHLRAD